MGRCTTNGRTRSASAPTAAAASPPPASPPTWRSAWGWGATAAESPTAGETPNPPPPAPQPTGETEAQAGSLVALGAPCCVHPSLCWGWEWEESAEIPKSKHSPPPLCPPTTSLSAPRDNEPLLPALPLPICLWRRNFCCCPAGWKQRLEGGGGGWRGDNGDLMPPTPLPWAGLRAATT